MFNVLCCVTFDLNKNDHHDLSAFFINAAVVSFGFWVEP